jgi:tetratricopeptide (TPR) repeat protein
MLDENRLKLKEESDHPTVRVADDSKTSTDSTDLASSGAEPNIDNLAPKSSLDPNGDEARPAQDISNASTEALHLSHPSQISEQELLGLAMHPHAPESEWLKACAELNRREQLPPLPGNKKSSNQLGLFVTICAIILSTGIACAVYFAQPRKVVQPANTIKVKMPAKPTAYMHMSSEYQRMVLSARAKIVVANAIVEKEWTEAEAAENLHVEPQVISDILRDNPTKLSVEELSEMAMLMGKPAIALVPEQSGMIYSPGLPPKSELNESLTFYTRAINLGNRSLGEYEHRAQVHDKLKQYDQAIADYDRCLEIDPKDSNAREMRAMVNWHAGRFEAALKDFSDLLKLAPEYDCYQSRAIVYESMGDYKNALKDDAEAISRMKELRPGPFSNRAALEEKLGMTKEAIADYKKAIEADPTYKPAYERIEALQKLSSKR